MSVSYTTTQQGRLSELGAHEDVVREVFDDEAERDTVFRSTEKALVRAARGKIAELLHRKHMPDSAAVIRSLEGWLTGDAGFTQVTTPTIIPTEMLDRMTLTEDEPLRDQVFYVGEKRCLRPMLAPNLYVMMRELGRIAREPVRIFEVGSCFRRESQGARHLSEFTMLNLVEYGAEYEDGGQVARLEELAAGAMDAVGIADYTLERESSAVYGETIDIVAGGVELASGSYGPHALDAEWGVFEPWVGIGLGIERIALVKGGHRTISRVGRSISYIDGVPLNI